MIPSIIIGCLFIGAAAVSIFGTLFANNALHAWRLSRIIQRKQSLTGNPRRYGYHLRQHDKFGAIWELDTSVVTLLRRSALYGVHDFRLRGRRASFERILEVVCPSTGQHHFLRVPNDLRARTGRDAVAWTFQLSPDFYNPLKET